MATSGYPRPEADPTAYSSASARLGLSSMARSISPGQTQGLLARTPLHRRRAPEPYASSFPTRATICQSRAAFASLVVRGLRLLRNRRDCVQHHGHRVGGMQSRDREKSPDRTSSSACSSLGGSPRKECAEARSDTDRRHQGFPMVSQRTAISPARPVARLRRRPSIVTSS